MVLVQLSSNPATLVAIIQGYTQNISSCRQPVGSEHHVLDAKH
jgi:hypothetical protein